MFIFYPACKCEQGFFIKVLHFSKTGITLAVNLKHMIPYSQIAEWEINGTSHNFKFFVTHCEVETVTEYLQSMYEVSVESSHHFAMVLLVTITPKKIVVNA